MECQSGTQPGAAPAGCSPADISATLPGVSWPGSLVKGDHGEVSTLSGGVMLPRGSTPIEPITGRHWLFPRSFTRRPMGNSCEPLSQEGERRAYHVSPM